MVNNYNQDISISYIKYLMNMWMLATFVLLVICLDIHFKLYVFSCCLTDWFSLDNIRRLLYQHQSQQLYPAIYLHKLSCALEMWWWYQTLICFSYLLVKINRIFNKLWNTKWEDTLKIICLWHVIFSKLMTLW